MSDLHKKLLKDNPAFRHLPPRPPLPNENIASSGMNSNSKRGQRNKQRDYTVIPWDNYWDKREDIMIKENTFRVYIKGDSGPAFLFLHGGGFSGLSWSVLSSILVKKIKCQCIAVDFRGHGDTYTNNDEDLSVETLSNDIKLLVEKLWINQESPPIILVGHSMGGALAVHIAIRNYIKNLIALVVIDVVEGSALDALSSMQTFLQGRPKLFNSIEQAIEYSVRSNSIRNFESARVSIIGQLKKLTSTTPQMSQENCTANIMPQHLGSQSYEVMQTKIAEEAEEAEEESEEPSQKDAKKEKPTSLASEFKHPDKAIEKYVWRIDLTKTEIYWKEWFKGLSSMFLNVSAPKLLLLAGVDRLDKELMVGQMQGRFGMQVLPQCGHAVHEDSPEEVANALSNFVLRFQFTESLEQINLPRLDSC